MNVPLSAVLTFSVALAGSGCAVVEVVDHESLNGQELAASGSAVAHVNVRNWGWYLFKFIPLATGNLGAGRFPQMPVFFRDNVQYTSLVEKLTATSRELGADAVVDIVSRDKSAWQPATMVLWLNEIEVSGNAIRLAPSADADEPSQP